MSDVLWTPGCGKPHPAAELIKKWADGQVAVVLVERPGCHAVKQQYQSWHPSAKYESAVERETWMRAFRHDDDIHHTTVDVHTKESRTMAFTRAERGVLSQYSTVTWMHDWVKVDKSKPSPKLLEEASPGFMQTILPFCTLPSR